MTAQLQCRCGAICLTVGDRHVAAERDVACLLHPRLRGKCADNLTIAINQTHLIAVVLGERNGVVIAFGQRVHRLAIFTKAEASAGRSVRASECVHAVDGVRCHIRLSVWCVVRSALRVQGRADDWNDVIEVALYATLAGPLGAKRADNVRSAVNARAAVVARRQRPRGAVLIEGAGDQSLTARAEVSASAQQRTAVVAGRVRADTAALKCV